MNQFELAIYANEAGFESPEEIEMGLSTKEKMEQDHWDSMNRLRNLMLAHALDIVEQEPNPEPTFHWLYSGAAKGLNPYRPQWNQGE